MKKRIASIFLTLVLALTLLMVAVAIAVGFIASRVSAASNFSYSRMTIVAPIAVSSTSKNPRFFKACLTERMPIPS